MIRQARVQETLSVDQMVLVDPENPEAVREALVAGQQFTLHQQEKDTID